ncbi:hypothetical protein Lser_V15G28985 [Lactuca serriola]
MKDVSTQLTPALKTAHSPKLSLVSSYSLSASITLLQTEVIRFALCELYGSKVEKVNIRFGTRVYDLIVESGDVVDVNVSELTAILQFSSRKLGFDAEWAASICTMIDISFGFYQTRTTAVIR